MIFILLDSFAFQKINITIYLFMCLTHVARYTKTCIACVGPWWIKRGGGGIGWWFLSFSQSLFTVNHSLNIVDPDAGAHTQRRDNTWWWVKRSMPRTGTSKDLFGRKLSTEMAVASALCRWSFWKHYSAYRRLIRSAQRCVNCSSYHSMHCSWSDRHFMEERNKIHSLKQYF